MLKILKQVFVVGDEIEAALPSHHALQTAVSHARDWLSKVRSITILKYVIPFVTRNIQSPKVTY